MKEDDNFTLKFKYYKSNKPQPSLNDVISVENSQHIDKVVELPRSLIDDSRTNILGLKAFNEWKKYSFVDHPGLFLLKNPFTSLGQRYWIRRCLEAYPRKPNKRNIDIEVDHNDWWENCHNNQDFGHQLLKKLRWTTLGYHHNWDTKMYSDQSRTEFPEELAELSEVVALYLGYVGFKAEAAIVNYYHMKSTLSAHTDHSEVNLEAPLFSFSFGQSAIFLIGGQNKSVTPTAILLESGDIMIMSKEARLCYHAVPKILSATATPWNEELNSVISNKPILKYIRNVDEIVANLNLNVSNNEWSNFNNYVQESRINMNVRQVLNETQKCLKDTVSTIR